MLIEFTVGNFLSFKEKKTLSMESSSITTHLDNVFQEGNYNLLRSAVVYGANSSGKSNLIKAFKVMRALLLNSSKLSSTDELKGVIPFLLNEDTENECSFFEILFIIEGVRYRYGFEVNRAEVKTEWLFQKKTGGRETVLFVRYGQGIEVRGAFKEGEGLEDRTSENKLFLSVVDNNNGGTAKKIFKWFKEFRIVSGLDTDRLRSSMLRLLENDRGKEFMFSFTNGLNLGFKDINIEKGVLTKEKLIKDGLPEDFVNNILSDFKDAEFLDINTVHNVYDNAGSIIGTKHFDIAKYESEGTKKIIDMSGELLEALISGGVLIIDELDAKLHPLLTLSIVKLFNSKEVNVKNAQLIFATHDTNLLSSGDFRRDQIYFTEKNQNEATDLYSLVEFKDVNGKKARNDSDYIKGRYGAIPFLGNLSNIFNYGKES